MARAIALSEEVHLIAPQNRILSLYLRILGLAYAAAFGSMAVQWRGLIGKNGILPADEFLRAAYSQLGISAYALLPTLGWLSSADWVWGLICWSGLALSLVLVAAGGRLSAWICPLLFLLYLSLVNASDVFLQYQWDMLLLECGFLALFLDPARDNRVFAWVHRVVLFKLVFSSGVVKLLSRDPTWAKLTALRHHFETQPLPTFVAWYVNLLPDGFLTAATLFTLFVELIVPIFFFAPRRVRVIAFAFQLLLQLGIALTGNYTFFNLLTVALCLFLLDDHAFFRGSIFQEPRQYSARKGRALALAGTFFILANAFQMVGLYRLTPRWAESALRWPERWHLVNGYGLFAVMTTERLELEIEGSNDGKAWVPYAFKYKAGALDKRPRFIAPYQPRLDWQMWFAALGTFEREAWLQLFLGKLLKGEPAVLALLDKNPFPSKPPTYLRVQLYDYKFTRWSEGRTSGNWWKRTLVKEFSPVLSLK